MIAITIDLPDSTAPDYVLVALVVEGKHLYTLTPLHKTPLIQKNHQEEYCGKAKIISASDEQHWQQSEVQPRGYTPLRRDRPCRALVGRLNSAIARLQHWGNERKVAIVKAK